MNERTCWYLVNGALLAAGVLGFGFGIAGFAAVTKFVVWLYVVLGAALFALRLMGMPEVKVSNPVSRDLDLGYDLVFAIVLAFCGAWGYAVIYLIGVFLVQVAADVCYPSDTK